MPYANQVFIMGHLGRDAETKFTSSGHSITNFSVAVEVGTKEKPRTAWIDCKAWNQCEAAIDILRKGALVAVSGRIDQETWEDRESGQKRSKTLVMADMIHQPQWEKREKKEDSGLVSQPRGSQQRASQAKAAPVSQEITDDDVPW